jgi:hypothetical protein
MEDLSCNDCKYYLPVDVFSGLCKLNKEKISPENKSCPSMELLAKCKFCAGYTTEKGYLGKCMGTKLAYPDMTASKCTGFQWYKQN